MGGVEGLGKERVSVGGWEYQRSLTELEHLGMKLDDGDLVAWRHDEGVRSLIVLKPGRSELFKGGLGGENDASPQTLRRSSISDKAD